MTTPKDARQDGFPPRLFLRAAEVKDLCEFDMAEGDVFAIYSPRTYLITHHDAYLSLAEHHHEMAALRESLEILARAVKDISYGLTLPKDDVQRAIRLRCDATIADVKQQGNWPLKENP